MRVAQIALFSSEIAVWYEVLRLLAKACNQLVIKLRRFVKVLLIRSSKFDVLSNCAIPFRTN